MPTDRTLTTDRLESMVQCIRPEWRVRTARPADHGHHIVYHLTLAGPDGTGEYVLKATPPDETPVCGAEARILAILGTHTDLPVPTVLGVVDQHDTFPAPFFLATALEGQARSRFDVGDLPAARLRTAAVSIGRHLATLHSFEAVDSYGFLDVEPTESLAGGQPSAALDQLRVTDGASSWRAYLEAETDRVTDGLAETRFAALAPRVREALEHQVATIPDDQEPVLARIDQSLEHALLDPASGAVTGLLDWEFTMAATAGYDLVFVEHSLAGGHWTLLPDTPDRRPLVRSALHQGYRAAGGGTPAPGSARYECYSLLQQSHAMLHFDAWFANQGTTDDSVREEAAAELARRVEAVV